MLKKNSLNEKFIQNLHKIVKQLVTTATDECCLNELNVTTFVCVLLTAVHGITKL